MKKSNSLIKNINEWHRQQDDCITQYKSKSEFTLIIKNIKTKHIRWKIKSCHAKYSHYNIFDANKIYYDVTKHDQVTQLNYIYPVKLEGF